MSLKHVYKMLEELAKTRSSNKKVELLKGFLKDKDFEKVAEYALDERLTYYVKKFPSYKKGKRKVKAEDIFALLKRMNAKGSATKKDKEKLFKLAAVNKATYEVVRRICIKDLRCGCSIKTFNKVNPAQIAFVPYQRCRKGEKALKNIQWTKGVIVQEKVDGTFANLWIQKNGKIKFVTRNFQNVKQLKKLKKAILDGIKKSNRGKPNATYGLKNHEKDGKFFYGKVLHGELVVIKKGKVLDRKTGNGIISQCIQGTASKKDADSICYRVWDYVPEAEFWIHHKYKSAYQTRAFEARKFVRYVNDERFVQNVKSKLVNSLQEAKRFYADIRLAGGEGAIVKNLSGIWKDSESGSPDTVKMKNVSDGNLRVVGWKYGKKDTKFEHVIGSILCESECGKLAVAVPGLKDEEREWDWDMMTGEIIEAEFESVIKEKSGKKKWSLYLPGYVRIRHDATHADTLKQLQKACKQ